jgi:hypothetical protein
MTVFAKVKVNKPTVGKLAVQLVFMQVSDHKSLQKRVVRTSYTLLIASFFTSSAVR